MPLQVSFRIDPTNLVKAVRLLKTKAPVCIARAVNRASKSAETLMVREIAADTGLPQARIRRTLTIRQAHESNEFVARIECKGARIPLIDFQARGPEPSRGRGRVTANTGQGRKVYRNLFIATVGAGGHRGVFERVPPSKDKSAGAWTKNLPIKERFGPSMVHVFEKVSPAGVARGEEQLVKNLEHEFTFMLSQQSS